MSRPAASKAIADAAERQRALDPGESFIVQAPAGSGKTELLIQRFLSLLARVDHPESVLAITFTIKATGEMRDRILAALREAEGPAPAEPHRKQTWTLARAALGHDREHGWRLLENPSRLRIQTMDALCASIVRQMPWLSRFGALPDIQEKADVYYRAAARATLEALEAEDDPATSPLELLLHHLDNDFAKVEKLLTGMLVKRDQWLRHVVSAGERADLEQAFRNIIEESLEAVRRSVPAARAAALLSHTPLADFPGAQPEDLTAWLGVAEKLLTKGPYGKPRSGVQKDKDIGLPAKHPFYLHLRDLSRLPRKGYNDSQWSIIEALYHLLRRAAAELKLVFQREGVTDFQELGAAARLALGSPEEPTELAFSLDYRIQHILVDEFQDTSYSQYDLIRSLTADWQPGDGRTLFAVGDPMQSIYLFRDAEVGLFLRARQEGLGQVPLTPLQLGVNFRSGAGLVEWVNQAFPDAFSEEEDAVTGAVAYAPFAAFHPADDGPPVVVHPLFEPRSQLEAEKIVEIVRQARAANPEGTVAILVRARSHLAETVPLLRRAGLRFRAVEIDELGARAVVQDLLSLTRALLHPADRRSWLALLRAPWCGLRLEDLHALAGEDHVATVWELLNDPAVFAKLSSDGQARAERVREVLVQALGERGRLALCNWVESVWIAVGGPACLEDDTSVEDASTYLNLLESMAVSDHLADLDTFEESVAVLFAQPDVEASDALEVMTIHKAKGLEFDTVIVPGLGQLPPPEDPRLLLWLERPGRKGLPELLLAPICEAGADDDPIYSYLKWVEGRKTRHEHARMLYVAATRARKQLHLLGHTGINTKKQCVNAPDSRTLLHKIWPAVEDEFQRAYEAQFAPRPVLVPEPQTARPGILLRRLPPGWQPPAPPADVAWGGSQTRAATAEVEEPPITFEWVGATQRHVGTVVHAALQRIAAHPELRWDAAILRSALAAQGVPPRRLDDALHRVTAALEATVADERGRWLLAAHGESQSELPISGDIDGQMRHFVIDRTFVDENGVRWIIDYKTSTHEGGGRDAFLDNERVRYQEQLERYAALLRRMDHRPIRLGIYFPLLQGWREWPYEQQQSFGFGAS